MLLCLFMPVAGRAEALPVFQIVPQDSAIKFLVSASVSVSGAFDQWNASLTFASNDAATGVLDIKIQAASVNTGSGLKNNKLKSADFFDVANNPTITFHSTRIMKTGPDTVEVDGDFTIRGVTKPEKLTLTVSGAGTGSGEIKGTMAFNRKDYGINGSIPLVRIADRVEVTVALKAKRVSGPAVVFKQ
jgi:polyisoprenoid-binding protein YceI